MELSGVLELLAATLYRLQYDSWHKYEPPRMLLVVPLGAPLGSVSYTHLRAHET